METTKYWTKDIMGHWFLSEVKPSIALDDLPMGFQRNCPICGELMMYRFKDSYEFGVKNKLPCEKCLQRKSTPTRNCHKCGKILYYINKYVYQNATTKDGLCNSCAKRKSD